MASFKHTKTHTKSFQLAPMSRSFKILALVCVGGLFFAIFPYLFVLVFNGGNTSEQNGGTATLLWLMMFTFPLGMGAAAIGFLGMIWLNLRDFIKKLKSDILTCLVSVDLC